MDFISIKYKVLLLAGLSIYVVLRESTPIPQIIKGDAAEMTMCGAPASPVVLPSKEGKFITLLPGWGNYTYPTSLKNDSAQLYFNQGMMMYYSYHMKEALASFKEAARLEPDAAPGYWGQALTMGPYYNAAHSYRVPDGIRDVLKQMNQYSHLATPKEAQLINAMNSRYPTGVQTDQTKTLDDRYALELKKLTIQYPDDPEIRILYIDAVMLQHAWDFWTPDGTIKPWTGEVIAICEEVLKAHPHHPAALHYYIHLTEASPRPEVSLPNGDALVSLFPGIPHMVHMASHTYQRNGQYAKGVLVNDLADSALVNYASRAPNLSLNKYSPHYFAVQTYCAFTGGMYDDAIKSAYRCRESVNPTKESTYDQYHFMWPMMTRIRMGRWTEILDDPIHPDPAWSYASLLHHFGRGMAFVHLKDLQNAEEELKMLKENATDPLLQKRRLPFNSPIQMAGIAEQILTAAILFQDKRQDESIEALQKAIRIEDELIYTEPNDWPLPARQFLGRYLLKMQKPKMAEKIYEEDLALNPQNGWSLLGLFQARKMLREGQNPTLMKAQYQKAFKDADEIPPGSVY